MIICTTESERQARQHIKLMYLAKLDEWDDKQDWLDIPEDERECILSLYRVWKYAGYATANDEGDVIADWLSIRQENAVQRAEDREVDIYIERQDEQREAAEVASRFHGSGE